MPNIIDLYSDYQHKKWFPQTYSDPIGELIDYINEEGINGIVAQWKKSGNRGLLQIAFELSELLPVFRFRDLYRDYADAYEKKLAPAGCRPQFSYFHLRKLEQEERIQLWQNLQEWAESAKARMFHWHRTRIEVAQAFKDLRTEYESAFGINHEADLRRVENWLTSTKDQFDLEFLQDSGTKSFLEVLAGFRLKNWDHVFDWNDFPELGRSFLKTSLMEKFPSLQKSELDEGVQACLPVFPPRRVIVEYGTAAGPCDSVRFIAESGKGCFYSQMNPEVLDEYRFSGDPRVAEFWRELFVLAFISKTGLRNIVGQLAVDLSTHLARFVSFWLRYDAFLALYRNAAEQDLQAAEDAYAENWRKAFSLEIPTRLYLFDLDRSASALSRVQAMEAALYVQEQLRTLYGNGWVSSTHCAARFKDYWWEGFKLSLKDLLEDLNIRLPQHLELNFES